VQFHESTLANTAAPGQGAILVGTFFMKSWRGMEGRTSSRAALHYGYWRFHRPVPFLQVSTSFRRWK